MGEPVDSSYHGVGPGPHPLYRGIMRRPNDEEWTHLVEDGDVEGREEWMDGVSAVFNYFAERTPGSYIEKQATVLQWARAGTLPMVSFLFFIYFFRWVWSLVNVKHLRDQSLMAGNEFRILFFVSKTSDLGAALFSNCFCWGRVLPEKTNCLEEYMYRWSWDNAQFDFGSAQAREVLLLGLANGRVVWTWFQGKGGTI